MSELTYALHYSLPIELLLHWLNEKTDQSGYFEHLTGSNLVSEPLADIQRCYPQSMELAVPAPALCARAALLAPRGIDGEVNAPSPV